MSQLRSLIPNQEHCPDSLPSVVFQAPPCMRVTLNSEQLFCFFYLLICLHQVLVVATRSYCGVRDLAPIRNQTRAPCFRSVESCTGSPGKSPSNSLNHTDTSQMSIPSAGASPVYQRENCCTSVKAEDSPPCPCHYVPV